MNIPIVNENDKEITAGKVLLAEYGTVDRREMAKRDILESRKVKTFNCEAAIVARYAGWNIAGSVLRWNNGAYGCILYHSNGTTSGQWYKSYDDAAAHFARLPE